MKRLLALSAAGVLALLGAPLIPAYAVPAPLNAHSVTISVTDVTPSTPVPSVAPRRLTIQLTLQNNTNRTLTDLSVAADRSDPLFTQATLERAIAQPRPPTPELVAPVNTPALVNTLAAGSTGSMDLPYRVTTSTGKDSSISLYADAIYPLYFTATYTDPDTGVATVVGTTQTYLPSFTSTTPSATTWTPLQVTWIWPLLDRPHRLGLRGLFLDDDLAGEVAVGGRLDRALQVVEQVEQVAPDLPLTLVVDPDLLDELEVMAHGYRVSAPSTKAGTVAGQGGTVAQAWLGRFTALLAQNPEVEVDLTAFADPDVEALTGAGLSWTPAFTGKFAQDNITSALGARTANTDVDWPYGSTLSQDTLTQLIRQQVSTVVVGDTTLPRGRSDPNASPFAQVQTPAGPATAAVTSGLLEQNVHAVLRSNGTGLAALPTLVARLAMRALTSGGTSHSVVLTAPRTLTSVPDVAARLILATAHTFWTRALNLTSAEQSAIATNHGVLHLQSVPQIPHDALLPIQSVEDALPGLDGEDGLFSDTSQNAATSVAVATIGRMPAAVQRAVSCGLITDPDRSIQRATLLAHIVGRIRAGVHLVAPHGNGSYTLTSNDAPLPVTVSNTLDVQATVILSVSAEDNRPGFTASSKTIKVPAGTTQQVPLPTSIDIAGRIEVIVTLSSPSGLSVGGQPLHLSVRDTALGTVGVAITTIAAIILAIALLFRAIRAIRWRIRARNAEPGPPLTDPLAD